MKKYLLLLFVICSGYLSAQVDTSASALTFTGYAEVYYAYDFNQPANHERPSFIYNFNRHNEMNLNLGLINANYNSNNIRGNLGFMVGTWAQYNSSAEQALLKNVWQANVGLKLSREKNFWLDAGIFPSHIGFESPIGKGCDALTRCIMGDNTPSWESGIKIGYATDNGKWFLSGLIINGWQRIARVDGNNTPAFGTQITFTPSSKFALNYSTFIGNDKPDEFKQMRYYHNFFALLNPTDKLRITLGFDYCMEQKSKGSNEFNTILSPALLIRLALNDKWSITGRGEYYTDENGIFIATGTPDGFKTSSFSLNLDRKIGNNALWRIEGRMLNSKDDIFNDDGEAVNTNTALTTSLSISF